jgi:hypothetical protein
MDSKFKAHPYEDGFEIVGNRQGLRELARICLALANLSEDDETAKLLGNHHHFADYMNTAEPGSTPFIILYKPDL